MIAKEYANREPHQVKGNPVPSLNINVLEGATTIPQGSTVAIDTLLEVPRTLTSKVEG